MSQSPATARTSGLKCGIGSPRPLRRTIQYNKPCDRKWDESQPPWNDACSGLTQRISPINIKAVYKWCDIHQVCRTYLYICTMHKVHTCTNGWLNLMHCLPASSGWPSKGGVLPAGPQKGELLGWFGSYSSGWLSAAEISSGRAMCITASEPRAVPPLRWQTSSASLVTIEFTDPVTSIPPAKTKSKKSFMAAHAQQCICLFAATVSKFNLVKPL
eukprot:SAG31_NODE_274_length_18666_cov_72.753972_14_plen_215_part_00